MKLAKILLAVLVMAAMVTPAIAEDRLTLSGSMQVRGQMYDYDLESTEVLYTEDDVYDGMEALEKELREDWVQKQSDALAARSTCGLFCSGSDNLYDSISDYWDAASDAESAYSDAQSENFDPGYDVGDVKTKKQDDSAAWNDMRLRIAGKLAVAEGVSVHFRLDAVESNENSSDPAAWGSTKTGSGYRYTNRRADIQFDKAYLRLEKNGFTLMAGQMYFGGFGYTQSINDFTAAGFILKYGDFTIQHSTGLEENLGNETLLRNDLGGDASTTAAKYVFKGDGWSLTPMAGYIADSSDFNYDLLGLALAGSVNLGPVMLKGEIDYLDGERDATATKAAQDLVGLQVYLDGSMAATDTLRIGLVGLYAEGQAGTNDTQVTSLNADPITDWAFVDFNPQNLGSGDFAYSDNFDIFDPGKFYGRSGSGVVGGQIYADLKASDDLSFKFGALAFETEEDKIADLDGYFLNAKATYKLMANTTLSSHLNYMSVDDNDYKTTDEAVGLITTLAVKF